MKYFLDTEFHEYKKQPTVCGIKVGKPIDTIELISIGIVSEATTTGIGVDFKNDTFTNTNNSREYYAICKDFDLKDAWNNEWLRENVLQNILKELVAEEEGFKDHLDIFEGFIDWIDKSNSYFKLFKRLINKYGKTREQIAEEIYKFIYTSQEISKSDYTGAVKSSTVMNDIEFYAYYADYDWVVFCWLFGKMINLPDGFPTYCIDLKQDLDRKLKPIYIGDKEIQGNPSEEASKYENYPTQDIEHNALADAKWNKELYKFINTL